MSDVKVATTKEQRLALLEKVGQSLLKMPYKSWNFGDSTGFEGVLVTGKLPIFAEYEGDLFRKI
jgi:unsaturated rhamnogalacturonyl hydrolase